MSGRKKRGLAENRCRWSGPEGRMGSVRGRKRVGPEARMEVEKGDFPVRTGAKGAAWTPATNNPPGAGFPGEFL